MPKAPVHGTRSRTGSLKKKNDTAADDLQKLVDGGKLKMLEDKKKKKLDQEKTGASSVTISPPSTNDASLDLDVDKDMNINIDEDTTTQTDDCTKAEEEDEALARHGIISNHLFGKEQAEETTASNEIQTVNLTANENSPVKKNTKSAYVPSSVKENNGYTTKSFSIAKTVHKYDHPRTCVETAITLMKEDKPKEFIPAIKSLLANGKILDPHFALASLKRDIATKTPPNLLTAEDDVPVNFMHLGQYAYTLGNRIFEKKKDWKGDNTSKKAGHRDNAAKEDIFCDPIVYFTIAIATDIPPRNLINGIQTEWEAKRRRKVTSQGLAIP